MVKTYTVYYSGKIKVESEQEEYAKEMVFDLLKEKGFYDFSIEGVQDNGEEE